MSAMNVHACPRPKLAPTVGAREAKRYWEGALGWRGEVEEGDGPQGAEEDGAAASGAAAAKEEAVAAVVAGTHTVAGISWRIG